MLNPFRIRNLYFNTSDWGDQSGVVQISSQQYDQEVQATPDARFSYLDEDDGETVTVGSAFELEQRLLEPPGRFSSWQGYLPTDNPSLLHVFDIQQSARAAEAWSKYVIHYTQQPAVPLSAPKSEPRLQKRKQEDYQSLLAKVHVLELEVKLLKEAFKMHTITTPVQCHQPHPSVFANACKNSNLLNHSPSCAADPTPAIHRQNLHAQPENQYSNAIVSNWRRCPELHTPKHDQNEDDMKAAAHSSDPIQSLSAAPVSGFLDPLRLSHSQLLPQGQGTRERDTVDRNTQRNFLPRWQSGQHDMLIRDLSKTATPSSENLWHDFSQLSLPKTKGKEILTDDVAATVPADSLISSPFMQQMTVDSEAASTSSPVDESRHTASKSLLDLEPEAEIARFPTIFQLEKEGLHSVQKSSTVQDFGSPTLLARANTVTSSNPAARLLKPFDPAAESLGVTSNQTRLPRRSGTERYRRRPYAEQFSGTGRTLWEEFERSGSQAQSMAPSMVGRMEPRIVDFGTRYPNGSVTRSQSLNHHHPSDQSQSRHVTPSQSTSTFVLSETQRNHHNPPTLGHPRNLTAAASSTPYLLRRSATTTAAAAAASTTASTDPSHPRSQRIQSCTLTLQEMGYKPQSRLPVYAEVCDGNISKAITMVEEDEKATQEAGKVTEMTAKALDCVRQLKEMGYGVSHHDEELKRFARDAEGDAGVAVEALEAPSRSEMEEWGERRRLGLLGVGQGMPGSFP